MELRHAARGGDRLGGPRLRVPAVAGVSRLGEAARAVRETPRRIIDSWLDPVRRKHNVSFFIETCLPVYIVTWSAWKTALVYLLRFVLYEWVLEPFGTARNPIFSTGRYLERGPREDETFVRP